MGEAALYLGDHHIHMALVLEGALHALPFVVFHHQVGNGTENALAGKRAPAHGNALVGSADVGYRDIEAAVEKKAVQIQGLCSHAAGAEHQAGLPVFPEFLIIQGGSAQSGGFEIQHRQLPERVPSRPWKGEKKGRRSRGGPGQTDPAVRPAASSSRGGRGRGTERRRQCPECRLR